MQKPRAMFAGLSNIARTLADPRDHPPLRVPTFPALERTAVLAFTDTSTIALTPAGLVGAVLLRDPAYPLWIQQARAISGSQYSATHYGGSGLGINAGYSYVFDNVTATPEYAYGALDPIEFPLVNFKDQLYYGLGFRGASAGSIASPTFSLFAQFTVSASTINECYADIETVDTYGNTSIRNYTYVPVTVGTSVGTVFALENTAIAARFISVGVKAAGNVVITTSSFGISTDIANSNANPSVAPPTNTFTRMFPLNAPPEAKTASLVWQAARANATSVLFKNVTAVLNKEGTAYGARVAVASFPAFDASQWSNFSIIHPKDRYFGALENGLYAFSLPDVASDSFLDRQNFASYGSTVVVPNSIAVGVFHFDMVAYATCLLMADLDSSAASVMAITLDRHIEFRTTSRIFQTDYAHFPLEEYHQAQMALVRMGTIFENNKHVKQINAATRGSRKVKTKQLGNFSQAGMSRPPAPPRQQKSSKPKQSRKKPKSSKSRK